jgi:Phytanoyl-CoA dioxygenase (PhyH)
MATRAEKQAAPWLGERSFASWREEFDRRGYLIFERVLPQDRVAEIRAALAPHLARDLKGRNDFEGVKTNRVYALLAKSPVFAGLVAHPLAMAFVEAELGESCLLSALLAISLQPGETVQPWHFDAAGAVKPADFNNRAAERETSDRADAIKMIMPSGSLAITKGTLWHRGGANRSDHPRLILTPQYCVGWVRQLENMCLAVPPEIANKLPERVRELIGYSIHPPFMGHVDGLHPKRLLQAE